ncbi:MAG: hypothetical protein HC845_13910 [Akkermansiaceae bacterium]|nr:hypothetical protein [Akkermansiaceae bacterium]
MEKEDVILELTRHGKVVAKVVRPHHAATNSSRTVSDLMGSLRHLQIGIKGADFDEPTFAPEDWEEQPANKILP